MKSAHQTQDDFLDLYVLKYINYVEITNKTNAALLALSELSKEWVTREIPMGLVANNKYFNGSTNPKESICPSTF